MKRQFIALLAALLFACSALAAYQKPCTTSEITRAAKLKTICDTWIGLPLSCFAGYTAGTIIQPQLSSLSHDNAVGVAIVGGIGIGVVTCMAFRELCMAAYTLAGYSEHDRAKIRVKNNKEEEKLLIEFLASGAILLVCTAMRSVSDAILRNSNTAFQADEKKQTVEAVVEPRTCEVVPTVNATTYGSEYFICNE